MISRSVAASSASSSICRSSARGSRSPTCGAASIRSSPSRRARRGNSPSSSPRMHTTRCGTERIGTSVHTVRWPVRKFARVGRPRSRSASSTRTSASSSVAALEPVSSAGLPVDVAEQSLELAPLPGVPVAGGGERVGGVRRSPRSSRGSALARESASAAARVRSMNSANRPARSIAPLSTSSSGSTPPTSRRSSSVIATPTSIRSRPLRHVFGRDRAEPERLAMRRVEPPPDPARGDPILHPRQVVVVEAGTAGARARARPGRAAARRSRAGRRARAAG